jgi:DNA-binding winged helix-turn-helix (wHTH) protein
VDTSSLWRDDTLVPLPPKAVAVLAALVAQAVQVVTKEALFAATWPDTAVTDGVLKGCIRQIRRALGEGEKTAQYIATVHWRGYRFCAAVTPVEVPASGAGVERRGAAMALRAPSPVVSASPAGLVGREAELAQLQQCWIQACQGLRQVVFITGEAGIGKTTLVDAFVAQLAATAGVWSARGQCLENYGAAEAYLPLLEALGRLGWGSDGAHLVALLHQVAPTWLLHMPSLVPAAAYEAVQRRSGGTTRERMLRVAYLGVADNVSRLLPSRLNHAISSYNKNQEGRYNQLNSWVDPGRALVGYTTVPLLLSWHDFCSPGMAMHATTLKADLKSSRWGERWQRKGDIQLWRS